MIKLVEGDILESKCEAIVNPVNCVGVSGKGLAKIFKFAFPYAQKKYEAACKAGKLTVGNVLVYPVQRSKPPFFVVYFPTKEHWRGKSKWEYIDAGFRAMAVEVKRIGWESLAIPALGCGLGGLDWNLEVYPMLVSLCNELLPHVNIELYPPLTNAK